jgi:hypothetical protein
MLSVLLMLLLASSVSAQKVHYTNQTEAGILIGDATNPSFSLQTFNGVKVQQFNLETGLTSGIDIYSRISIIPVSAGLKWNPLNTGYLSPLLSLNAGYGFGWMRDVSNNAYAGGFMINPSIGLRIKTKDAAKLSLSIGYKQQKAENRQTFDYNENDMMRWVLG